MHALQIGSLAFCCRGLFYLAIHNLLFRSGLYSSLAGFQGRTSSLYGNADFARAGARILAFAGTESLGGALWFLPMLFAAEVVFVGVSWASTRFPLRWREPVRLTGVALVVLIGWRGQLDLPILREGALVAVFAVYAGTLARRSIDRIPWRGYIAMLGLLLLAALGGTVDFGGNRYAGLWQLVTVTLAGAYVNFYAARRIEDNRLLRYVGRNTIFILATHFVAFKLVSMAVIATTGYPEYGHAESAIQAGGLWWVAYFVVGMAVPTAVKYGLDVFYDFMRARRADKVATESVGS